MPALNWKSGALVFSITGGAIFGVKELITQNKPIKPPPFKQLLSEEEINDGVNVPLQPAQLVDSQILETEESSVSFLETNSHEREEKKKKVEALIKKLDDYTFKLFSNCNYGTGWILDYQIPNQKNKYPLVWYIATNAHVVAHYGFSQNPYKQNLAIDHQKIKNAKNKWKGRVSFSNFSLDRDANCSYRNKYGWFDFNISKQSDGREIGSDMGAVGLGKMKEPRLFYTSIDFLKNSRETGVTKGTHFKDFAVLEVEFTDEDYARKATRDFATKYPLNSTDAINIFGKSIEDRQSWKEIQDNEEDFFSLGYPWIKDKPFQYTVTWNEKTMRGEKLSNDKWNWYTDPQKHKKIKGYMDAKTFVLPYGKKKLQYFGHMYLTKGFLLQGGSSGSMYVDSQGNLIGLKSRGERGRFAMHSFVEPIRSKKIKEGSIDTPEYDLILGTDGQKSSYKQQIEKYVTNKGKSTWLSRRGWKHYTVNPRLT